MTRQKQNFVIIWISNLLVAGTMTMIMPFLSLYIETLGNFSESYVQRWSGLIFGATFVSAFLMSPIWGRVADKYGYKPILIVNAFGLAVSILLMGYVENVWQFFILRLLMGIVTGFIPTSLAFISAQTDKKEAGKTLGTLQMGSVSGTLFGPIVGGLMADAFGFHYTFLITAITVFIAGLMIIFGINEMQRVQKKSVIIYTRKEVLSGIFKHRLLLNVMLITSLIQIGNFSIQPLLSLYVADLIQDASQVTFLAGLTFSAAGLGNILFARFWGRLGDQIGYEKVLFLLLGFAVLFMIPQAWVTSLWQLIILRLIYGTVLGGLVPITSALIRREAPVAIQGEVMGYSTSFRFFGNIIGPLIGGFISGIFSISAVFYSTAILFLIAFLILYYIKKQPLQDLDDIIKERRKLNIK